MTKLNQHVLILLAACAGLCSGQIGVISTYAGNNSGSFPGDGGPATSALISNPAGLAFDFQGNLYIAASGNSLIRKVDGITGIISTVAGGGTGGDGGPATSAQLSGPCDVKIDGSGNVYFSETCVSAVGGGGGGGNGTGGVARIRRVDAVTGIITTIAGGTSSGFGGDGGPASSALLNTPVGLAINSAGDIFIADYGNNRIRKIAVGIGVITTIAGNGSAGFAGDGGPATWASLNGPLGVTLDANGNLYIADTGNNRIRRVDANNGNITTLAGTGAAAFNGDGIAATQASLNLPANIAFDPSGNLVFTDLGNYRVRTIDSAGLIWTLAGDGMPSGQSSNGDNGLASAATVNLPEGLVISSSRPMYVSELGGGHVRVVVPPYCVATALTVSAAASSFPPSSPVTLTATLAAANGQPYNANNWVVFFDGTTPIGAGSLEGGAVSMTTSALALGTHNIQAIYNGDGNFAGSYSPVFTVTIAVPTSSVSLSANPNPATANQPVTLTATVTPTAATGSVTFYNGGAILGSAPVSFGGATLSNVSLAAGSYSLTARYSGDSMYSTAVSSPVSLTVKAGTSVMVTSSLTPSIQNQAVTFTAMVTPTAASGTMQFLDGTTVLATVPLNSGSAVYTTSTLTPGTHSINAVYSGDSNDASSQSAFTQTVNPLTTTTIAFVSSQNPSAVGGPVTFTAAVTPVAATGTVQFLDGSTLLGTVTLSTGLAQFTTSALTQGTHSLTVVYSGDATDSGSTSAVLSQVVKQTTAMTLALSPNPSVVGQTVAFTVTINPAATGTVQFLDGSTVLATLATVPANAGVVLYNTYLLTQGSHQISAIYSGDSNYLSAQSAALTQTVNPKTSTTTSVASNTGIAFVGNPVTFTASVNPAAATGSIQFLDGTTVLGSVTMASGSAAFTTSSLTAGDHSITAVYSGDATNAGSTSGILIQSVRLTAGLTFSTTPNPSVTGQTVTMTASVNAAATGTIQFFDGSSVLATSPVSSGAAVYSTSTLAQGSHSIHVAYSGDTNYASATTSPSTQTVNPKLVTTTTVASSQSPAPVNTSVTFTATVAPAGATGTIQFLDGPTALGTATLAGGSASLSVATLTAGAHSITAVYSGDATNAASTSVVLSQTINPPVATSVSLVASANPIPQNSSVKFFATVNPTSATGTVQFLDGATVLGTVTLTPGFAAILTTSFAASGNHPVTAVYSGDAGDLSSTSPVLNEGIRIVTTFTMATSLNPSVVGQTVTFTANITAAATGSVQFLDGATVLATVPLSSGVASYSTSALAQGSHSMSASYPGDSTYWNTTASLTQTVNAKASTTTTVTSSVNPSFANTPVTFAASVVPATATGNVQFLDGATVLAIVPLANGSAMFSTSSLAQGTHPITAVYGGDAVDNASTSGVLTEVAKYSAGLTVGLSANPVVAGQTLTISATMNSAATGTVTFTDGSTTLAVVNVSAGRAAYSTTTLAQGVHSLGISYSGDAVYMTASTPATETVLGATSISLSSSLNPAAVGQSVTFVATVNPAAATGNVQFYDGATLIATVALSNGTAAVSSSSLAQGSHSMTANYLGNSSYGASSASPVTEVVKANTSVVLSSSSNPSMVSQSVTFTATVTPSTATGVVQFLDGAAVIGTASLASGHAAFSTASLAQGSHSIAASYAGDANDAAASSGTLSQIVNPAPPAAPSHLTAAPAGSSQINLAWTPSATGGVTYDVYASTASGFVHSASNRIAAGVSAASYSATGLTASTTYYFLVTAINGGGESSATNQASAATTGVPGCHVSYSVSSQWNNGFNGAFSIKNTGTTTFTSWDVTWTWPGNQKVTQAWNANYTQTGSAVGFTNMSYNASIAPGTTLSGMGFGASYSNTNTSPTAFYVNGILCQ